MDKHDPVLSLFFKKTTSGGEYAVVVKLELLCHLNEVCNALFSADTATFEAAMRGHFGKKFR